MGFERSVSSPAINAQHNTILCTQAVSISGDTHAQDQQCSFIQQPHVWGKPLSQANRQATGSGTANTSLVVGRADHHHNFLRFEMT